MCRSGEIKLLECLEFYMQYILLDTELKQKVKYV